MKWTAHATTTVLLLLVSVLVCTMLWKMQALETRIIAVIDKPIRRATMQTISEEVTNTSGRTATISTTRLEDESVSDWLQRHQDAVVEFQNS